MINPLTLPRCIAKLAVVPALVAIMTATVPVYAEESQVTISPAAYGSTRNVELQINKSMLVDLPAGVAEVIVSRPDVAAAIMRTRTRAILQGITGGDTNIFFLDDAGRTISVLEMKIIEEPSQVGNALEAALARIIPGSNILVESITLGATNRVVLTGTVLSGDDSERAETVAVQFAGSPTNVANLLNVSGSQQVMLQVTVSEIRREVAKQLGINLSGTVAIGGATLGFNSEQTALTNGVNGSFPIGDVNLQAAIRALEERDALRVLAQPALTAMSGETATFLAGGEIITGFFDERIYPYGVQLEFTPTVKSNGIVGLKVNTSVSEPQVSGSNNKRQASTTVELAAGTTLAIGGLLDERTSQSVSQMPGIGNIPILGALFRSREYQTQQTELVILVTPYIVNSGPANTYPLPTNQTTVASDAEAIFLGKMENLYGVAGSGEMRGGFSGSVGFVLE